MCHHARNNHRTLNILFVSDFIFIFSKCNYIINNRWHDYSTVVGTIVQQSLARLSKTSPIVQQSLTQLFYSPGMVPQQSLPRFFNSHWQNFLFFLCRQKSLTVRLSVEESGHLPGMRHTIHKKFDAKPPIR